MAQDKLKVEHASHPLGFCRACLSMGGDITCRVATMHEYAMKTHNTRIEQTLLSFRFCRACKMYVA